MTKMPEYDTVCGLDRVHRYRMLKIEWVLYQKTGSALRDWTSTLHNGDHGDTYYVMLGKLATANYNSITRLNNIRAKLGLPEFKDEQTYPIKMPDDL